MAKEQWVKMESWTPRKCATWSPIGAAHTSDVWCRRNAWWGVVKKEAWQLFTKQNGKPLKLKTRAAALKAANKQNDLEGLPRVA